MREIANRAAAPEKVQIGGADQWILVRSHQVTSPIVLYVHGGPGASQLTSNRRHTLELEKYFTVVDAPGMHRSGDVWRSKTCTTIVTKR